MQVETRASRKVRAQKELGTRRVAEAEVEERLEAWSSSGEDKARLVKEQQDDPGLVGKLYNLLAKQEDPNSSLEVEAEVLTFDNTFEIVDQVL